MRLQYKSKQITVRRQGRLKLPVCVCEKVIEKLKLRNIFWVEFFYEETGRVHMHFTGSYINEALRCTVDQYGGTIHAKRLFKALAGGVPQGPSYHVDWRWLDETTIEIPNILEVKKMRSII